MVDAGYLEQFENGRLFDYLKEVSSAQFEQYAEHYRQVLATQPIEKQASLPKTTLQNKFDEMKTIVDKLLGCRRTDKCSIELVSMDENVFGEYNKDVRTILLNRRLLTDPVELRITMAHEYAHHVLDTVFNLERSRFSLFDEGFAYGVERSAASTFTRKYARPQFTKGTLEGTIEDLQWISLHHPSEGYLLPENILVLLHANEFGDDLFAVLEAERGPDIYRQILHGEFKW